MALQANPLQTFLWGSGGAALTPEQVAREREVANALMAQGMDMSPVGDWTQGAARMANVLSGKIREGRASRAESEGRSAFNDRLMSALGGGAFTSQASIAPELPSTLSGAAGTSTSAASIPAGERADYIRSGLVQRGLPTHVADAFLMNFQDESGLNPGINEAAPLVPGSRGGYGLYQLTGPRRREYEAFAAQRGAPLDDIDAQLDFLMREGAGSERGAFERILAAPDTGTAAVEIVNRFLRPAQSHREARAARYASAPNTAAEANEMMAAGDLMAFAGEPTQGQVIPAPEGAVSMADAPMLTWDDQGARMAPSTRRDARQANAIPYEGPGAQVDMPIGPSDVPYAQPVADEPLMQVAQALSPQMPTIWGGGMDPNDPSTIPATAGGTRDTIAPVAQALTGGGGVDMQTLMGLAADPWATDAQRQVVGALMQQQMQANDPMRQLELQRAQLELEQMRNPAAPKPIEVGGVLLDGATMQPIFDSRQQSAPASVQEYEYYADQARRAGQQPVPYDQWDMARRQSGANQINLGDQGQRMGSIPAGMAAVPDPSNPSGFRLEAIPGGPAAIDADAAAAAADVQTVTDAQKAEATLDATRSVLDILDNASTPATGTMSRPFALLSSTPAGRIRSYVGTLQSGAALGAMQRLREASATGSTGFGALSEKELELLINDIGALNPDNTEPDIFRKTIERIRDRSRAVAADIAKNVSPERIAELGLQPFLDAYSQDAAAGSLPQGVTEADIEHTMRVHGLSREEVLRRIGGR